MKLNHHLANLYQYLIEINLQRFLPQRLDEFEYALILTFLPNFVLCNWDCSY